MDAIALARVITSNGMSTHGISPTLRFDRIDVSTLGDIDNGGMSRILDAWGPFLKRTPKATLLAYFVSWTQYENDADISDTDIDTVRRKLVGEGKVFVAHIIDTDADDLEIELGLSPAAT